mmetsp:Transcript_23136/g.33150  ORF Transcript_23136/g.33150 Transcript_23136/m.33150 type:complete len:95 (+) Transcript_23136:286-570(+)
MCEELLDRDTMIDYIELSGRTALCDIATQKNCNEKEKAYLAKVRSKGVDEAKKQKTRLDGMMNTGMKAELEEWLVRRRRILAKIIDAESNGDEL